MAKRPAPELRVKRVYAAPEPGDGKRILVDRLWPRGLSKEAARIDFWAKALAPSDGLRKRVHADPSFPDDATAWAAFERAYRAELKASADTPEGAAAISEISGAVKGRAVTLLFGLKHELRNHALVLRDYLKESGAI